MQVGGIVKVASGSPMKVQAGRDLDGDTIPSAICHETLRLPLVGTAWPNPSSAINALRASFTDLKLEPIDASLLKLDLYSSLDMRVSKSLAIGRDRLELLVEAFNLLNHSNLRPPLGSPPNAGSNINSAAFLQRSVARDARQLQWGVRFAF